MTSTRSVNPLALNLRAVVGRAYPRIIGANREPSWVFFDAILPLLGIAAYVFIYEGFFRAPGADRTFANAMIGFVVLGGTMTAFWMNVLWSMASQLYWEKEMGNLQLYMMAPMSRMALLGGMALGGMFMTSTRAIVTLVAGVFVFGVHFDLANPLMILAVFFATLVALYGMGMMLASLYLLYGREAWHMSALLEEPIFLVSGFYFPIRAIEGVGAWGRAVLFGAAIIPATLGLDALRQLIFPGFFGGKFWLLSVELEFAILVVLCVVFLVLARVSLGYLEMLAKREGRLTSRHQ
ncbi:MAG: ABC transporter permease [Euryarchaeota archaeon]|nr:ABC transporter permease [Euryarchaeota archaeon]